METLGGETDNEVMCNWGNDETNNRKSDCDDVVM